MRANTRQELAIIRAMMGFRERCFMASTRLGAEMAVSWSQSFIAAMDFNESVKDAARGVAWEVSHGLEHRYPPNAYFPQDEWDSLRAMARSIAEGRIGQ